MGVAETSRLAYHGVQADGTECNQKAQIVAALKACNKGMTRRELSKVTGIEPGAVGGRVNALVAAGVLMEIPMMKTVLLCVIQQAMSALMVIVTYNVVTIENKKEGRGN